MHIVISDAGPLIALSRIHHLGLLEQLYGQVTVTDVVRDELLNAGAAAFDGQAQLQAALRQWVRVEKSTPGLKLQALNPNVDAGELSSIALCMRLPDSLLIVDDKAARLEAQARGLRFIGLLGVLLQAKQRGLLSSLAPVLQDLVGSGYFISGALLLQVLNIAGE